MIFFLSSQPKNLICCAGYLLETFLYLASLKLHTSTSKTKLSNHCMSKASSDQDDGNCTVFSLIEIERSSPSNVLNISTNFLEDVKECGDEVFLTLFEQRKQAMDSCSSKFDPMHILNLRVKFDLEIESRHCDEDTHVFSDVISLTRRISDVSSISSDGGGWQNSRKIQVARKGNSLDLTGIVKSSILLSPCVEGDTPPNSPPRDFKEIKNTPTKKKKKYFSVKKLVPKFLRRRSFSLDVWGSADGTKEEVNGEVKNNNNDDEPTNRRRYFARRRTL